jgi:hypothetical protein
VSGGQSHPPGTPGPADVLVEVPAFWAHHRLQWVITLAAEDGGIFPPAGRGGEVMNGRFFAKVLLMLIRLCSWVWPRAGVGRGIMSQGGDRGPVPRGTMSREESVLSVPDKIQDWKEQGEGRKILDKTCLLVLDSNPHACAMLSEAVRGITCSGCYGIDPR